MGPEGYETIKSDLVEQGVDGFKLAPHLFPDDEVREFDVIIEGYQPHWTTVIRTVEHAVPGVIWVQNVFVDNGRGRKISFIDTNVSS